MELKDVNFDKLETLKKRCILFAKNGNTVIKPYKTLYRIKDIAGVTEYNNLYLEVVKGKEAWEEDRYILYEDLGKICHSVGQIPGDCTSEKLTECICNYIYFGKEGFLKRLEEAEEKNSYINIIDIELCVILGESELAKHYSQYRENCIKRIEDMRKIESDERERKKRMEEELYQKEINNKIEDAERAIKEHRILFNEPIENTTIILYLFKKYGIDVPLKTQGWINKALVKIWFQDGSEITYSYYKSSKDSTVFIQYLRVLEEKINAVYGN